MATTNKKLVENITEDISFCTIQIIGKFMKKARQRGLNYYMQGYIHDIQLDSQNGTFNVRSKCYRDRDPTHLYIDRDQPIQGNHG